MEDIKKLLVKVAYYYYRKELTQGEIADKLHMSRQRVNRLLKKVKDEGIVTIQINGFFENHVNLESQLEEKYKLERAVVIPYIGNEDMYKGLGAAGADYLMSILRDNYTIGVAWGKTIFNLASCISDKENSFDDISVVQLVGSFNDENSPKQSDEITRILSNKLKAKSYFMFAPTYVKSAKARKALLEEESIKNVFDKMKNCDAIVYSIGELGGTYSPFKTTIFKEQEKEIIKRGAVGNICMRYFDIDGKILDIDLHKTVMSIDVDTLKNTPQVVCVAGGRQKEKAILGGLRGGLMKTLITDHITAKNILNID
ncbi:MAG: sugar-binding transcriptional regulator [Eubacteriaceae bacterium]